MSSVLPGGSEGQSIPYLCPEKSPLHCTVILGPEAASSPKGHVHEMLQTGGALVSSEHGTAPQATRHNKPRRACWSRGGFLANLY